MPFNRSIKYYWCKSRVHQMERKNWTNDKNVPTCFRQSVSCQHYNNADSHYNCQILHFRSERRVVLFILSGHVSEAPFLPFQSQSNAIEIRFFFSFPILSMPFNSNTPFIYLISWFLQSAAIFSIMVFITPTMCWLVGTCLLFTWLIEDITSELARLNPITSSNQHERDLKRQFFKIIQLHSDVRQLSAMQFSEHFFFWIFAIQNSKKMHFHL